MEWLGGWLREIVLVVMLAVFVEMLLPGKSMERYARLVLSLLVLLTLLSPLISLLKGDAASQLATELAVIGQGDTGSGGRAQLETILEQGRQLAEGRQRQSLELAAAEVAAAMRDQVTASTGIKGVNVSVALAVKEGAGAEAAPYISGVEVTLPGSTSGNADDAAGSGFTAAETAIKPVAPVRIEVDAGGSREEQTGQAAAGAPGDNELASSVVTLLRSQWGLEAGVVAVYGDGARKL